MITKHYIMTLVTVMLQFFVTLTDFLESLIQVPATGILTETGAANQNCLLNPWSKEQRYDNFLNHLLTFEIAVLNVKILHHIRQVTTADIE